MIDSKLLKKLKSKDRNICYKKLLTVVKENKPNVIFNIISNPDKFIKDLKVYNALNDTYDTDINIDKILLFVIRIINANKIHDLPLSKEFVRHADKYYTDFLNFSKLSEKSKNIFLSKIEQIKTKIYNNEHLSIIEIINDPDKFKKKVDEYSQKNKGKGDNETLSIHWKDATYNAILALFKHNQQFHRRNSELTQQWVNHHKIISNEIENNYNENKPSTERQKLEISYLDAVSIRDSLEDGSDIKLLLSFLTDMAPLRSDYGNVLLIKSKIVPKKYIGKANYIHNNKFYLNVYKTSKKYGTIELPISKLVQEQLSISLKKKPRNYLFTTQKDNIPYIVKYQKYYEKEFNKWANKSLRKVFKNKDISLTYFRHIYISRPDLNISLKTNAGKKEIANKMGHSIGQQSKYQWIE